MPLLEKPNCVAPGLHVVVGNGTNHFSTDGHSCSGQAAEDYRRIYRTGEFRDIRNQHREDDEPFRLG